VESRKAVKPFFRVPIDSSTAEAPDQLEGFAHRRVVHLALHNTNPNSLVEGRRSSFLRFVPRFAGLDTARQRTRAALPMTIRSQSDRSLVPSSSERRDDEHPTGAVGRQPERSAHLLRSRVRRDDPPPVGDGNDIAAQLGVGEAAFWVAPPSATMKRLSPRAIDGATAGRSWWSRIPTPSSAKRWPPARRKSPPRKTNTAGRVGRIIDPFGHEWEIGMPLGALPPD
jgi:PhnB protein